MAEDDLLPKSLQKLEIDSGSLLQPESQPSLESLSLRGDDCPQESCKCNKKTQRCDSSSAWNRRHFIQKPQSSRCPTFGIIRKSRFKPTNPRSKTWVLREPILKLETFSKKDDSGNTSSSASPVRLDPKPMPEAVSEISKLPAGQIKSQGKIFGACSSVAHNDFSRLRTSKSTSDDAKQLKQFSATSYRHIRFSSPSSASQPSKVVKRKKDYRKEGSIKSRPISDTTNTLSIRQTPVYPPSGQSTSCSQQARMVGTSHVGSGNDDVTIDELASYFDLFVHIPRKMSHMAENMYI